jgi:hypothetical protein
MARTDQVRLETAAHDDIRWFREGELGSGGEVELETVRVSALMALREVQHAIETGSF